MNDTTTTEAPDRLATMTELAGFDFAALITPEQVTELERIAQAGNITRRAALVILTRSKQELIAGFKTDQDAEVMLEVLDSLRDFGQQLKSQAEQVSHAETRLLCALSAHAEAQGHVA